MEILETLSDTKRKFILRLFIGLFIGIFFFSILFLIFKQPSKQQKTQNSISIWTYGMNEDKISNLFSRINDKIGTSLIFEVKNFQNYSDFKNAFPHAMAQGIIPDIFMIPNESNEWFLPYIEPIPEKINPTIFQNFTKNFLSIFNDDLIVSQDNQTFLMGAPVNFQVPGFIYNSKFFKGGPKFWNEIQLFLRKKWDIENWIINKSSCKNSKLCIESIKYDLIQNNIFSYRDLTQWKNVFLTKILQKNDSYKTDEIDDFIEEKIGMIIGYPENLEEIGEKIQENTNTKILPSAIKVKPTPVYSKNMLSIAKYNIFTVNSFSPENKRQMANFLILYLASKEWQNIYTEIFPNFISCLNSQLHTPSIIFGSVQNTDFYSDEIEYKSFLSWEKDLTDEKIYYIFQENIKDILPLENISKEIYCTIRKIVNNKTYCQE